MIIIIEWTRDDTMCVLNIYTKNVHSECEYIPAFVVNTRTKTKYQKKETKCRYTSISLFIQFWPIECASKRTKWVSMCCNERNEFHMKNEQKKKNETICWLASLNAAGIHYYKKVWHTRTSSSLHIFRSFDFSFFSFFCPIWRTFMYEQVRRVCICLLFSSYV